MGFGLCLGSIGVGKCGDTKSQQSVNVVNTAVATAYYKNAFSCKNEIKAGNEINTSGYCSCGALGIGNSSDCTRYRLKMIEAETQTCNSVLNAQTRGTLGLTGGEISCICKSAGAGCTLDVKQDSVVTSQQRCTNAADANQKLKTNFATDIAANLKSLTKGLGGLFDGKDQDQAIKIGNTISNNVSTSMSSAISNTVNTKNTVTTGCGGLTIGITQFSHFQNILTGLNSSKVIQSAMSDANTLVKGKVVSDDEGFLGFLSGTTGIILIIVVSLAILVGLYIFFKWERGGSKVKSK
jgi:hypothetical protein